MIQTDRQIQADRKLQTYMQTNKHTKNTAMTREEKREHCFIS